MQRRNKYHSRDAQAPRPFISDPLERKRKKLPVISGSEWRMYLSDEQIAAYADHMIERQKFFGSIADQQEQRRERFYGKYFSAPDFDLSPETVRSRVFHETAQTWDFDNP